MACAYRLTLTLTNKVWIKQQPQKTRKHLLEGHSAKVEAFVVSPPPGLFYAVRWPEHTISPKDFKLIILHIGTFSQYNKLRTEVHHVWWTVPPVKLAPNADNTVEPIQHPMLTLCMFLGPNIDKEENFVLARLFQSPFHLIATAVLCKYISVILPKV